MGSFVKLITSFVNSFHDFLEQSATALGWNYTDKELHFWVMGFIGIIIFAFVQLIFKWLSKWSITSVSFVYTMTVMVVIVFAIEIQQKITGRGNMELKDAMDGLYGFLTLFAIYLLIKLIIYLSVKLYKRSNK